MLPIVDAIMTIPIKTLKIGRADRRMLFDTDAKLSYVSEDLLVGAPVDETEDFHPSIGVLKRIFIKSM